MLYLVIVVISYKYLFYYYFKKKYNLSLARDYEQFILALKYRGFLFKVPKIYNKEKNNIQIFKIQSYIF